MPFPVPNSMLGPRGEAWAPVHGHVSLSNAPKMFGDVQALFADMAPDFAAHGVQTASLFSTHSTNAITIEPMFYWSEAHRPIHESLMGPGTSGASDTVGRQCRCPGDSLDGASGRDRHRAAVRGSAFPDRAILPLSRQPQCRFARAPRCGLVGGRPVRSVQSRRAGVPDQVSDDFRAIKLERIAPSFCDNTVCLVPNSSARAKSLSRGAAGCRAQGSLDPALPFLLIDLASSRCFRVGCSATRRRYHGESCTLCPQDGQSKLGLGVRALQAEQMPHCGRTARAARLNTGWPIA